MKKIIYITISTILLTIFLNTTEVFAQAANMIYGVVETRDGTKYEGSIRWGKEEVFWFDHFNSSKERNEYWRNLTDRQREQIENSTNGGRDGFSAVINGKSFNLNWSGNDHSHSFATEFGNIQEIRIFRDDEVDVTFQDGSKIALEGGSNDIGANIKVLDKDFGEVTLDWDRVKTVSFKQNNTNTDLFGDPIYGIVYTRDSKFEGFVQWDHDERVSTDKLDGDTRDGDLSIPFGKIKKITAVSRRGCDIELFSGRKFYLDGSNDVDDGNRGIIVNIPGQGRVDIPFDDFEYVEFFKAPKNPKTYNSYKTTGRIKGTVKSRDGKSYSGFIAYDLDETYKYEILNGKIRDIEFFIPFENIKSVERLGSYESKVTTKDNLEVKLSDIQDVTDNNDGILIFKSLNSEPELVVWRDVKKVLID